MIHPGLDSRRRHGCDKLEPPETDEKASVLQQDKIKLGKFLRDKITASVATEMVVKIKKPRHKRTDATKNWLIRAKITNPPSPGNAEYSVLAVL
jgi:hypothetical protein